jgi:hypothetical protein
MNELLALPDPAACTLTAAPVRLSTRRMFCISSVTALVPLAAPLAQTNPELSWKPICLQQQQQQQQGLQGEEQACSACDRVSTAGAPALAVQGIMVASDPQLP